MAISTSKTPVATIAKFARTESHMDREKKIEKGKLKNLQVKRNTHAKSCSCDECKGNKAK